MTSSRARRLLSWCPALVAMAAIFWLSSLPGDTIPLPGFRFSDKAVHFAAYAVLGILIGGRHALYRRLEGRLRPGGDDFLPGSPVGSAAAPSGAASMPARDDGATPAPASPGPPPFDRAGALIGILYGLSDELHQAFVPLREPSLGDFAADALGVAAGIWLTRRRRGGAYRRFKGTRFASPPLRM